MSPFSLFTTVAFLSSGISLADTLYVNNDTAFPAEYRSFDDAFAAAADGDTIMLAPSPTSYGDLDIVGKSVKVIGGGTSNKNRPLQPKQANRLDTIVDRIFIGFDEQNMTPDQPVPDFSAANGTHVSSIRTRMGVWIWSDDCVFTRSETDSSLCVSGDRNIITGCELARGLHILEHLNPVLISTGNLISDCLITNGSQVNNYASVSFSHCVIGFNSTTQTPAGSGTYSTFASTTFRHCVIAGSTKFNSYRSDGTTLHHCLVVGTSSSAVIPAHSADNGNLTTTEQNSVFEEGFVLKDGSLAAGAGEDGEDLGIFGSDTPFEWGGLPALPLIEQFEVLSANPDTGLRFRVKAVARD